MKRSEMPNVFEAKTALNEFLADHPELAGYQKEIERRLSGAVTKENKELILKMMMTEKVVELQEALLKMAAIPKISLDKKE